MKDSVEKKRFKLSPRGVAIGVGAGVANAVALNDWAVGLAIGVALAITFGLSMSRRESGKFC